MCGMTRIEDISHAIDLGVDAIGLIFYSKSSRYIDIKKATLLLKNKPPFLNAVAVLVNPVPKDVHSILDEIPIDLLQFHGDESPEFCQQFNKPFIKAIQPTSTPQITQQTSEFLQAQAILMDTPSNKARGGTGLTFDWSIIPQDASRPYILAGGLNQFNVNAAIRATHPYAVDVCSGIESLPGIKDHAKMDEFVAAIRGME